MGIILLIISAILASIGQIFLKQSTIFSKVSEKEIIHYALSLILNPYSWLGALFYGISFLIYMFALKKINLSIARSFSSISYVLVVVLSIFIFKDKINILSLLGMIFISLGILFLSMGFQE